MKTEQEIRKEINKLRNFQRIQVAIIIFASIFLTYLIISEIIPLINNHRNGEDYYCFLYTWTKESNYLEQHTYPLVDEMTAEAKNKFNISDDYISKRYVFIAGDGHLSSYSFNTKDEPLEVNCIFDGFLQEGDIRTEFKVTKTINYKDLENWRNSFK